MLGYPTTGALRPRRWDSGGLTCDPLFPLTAICPFAFGSVTQSIGRCTARRGEPTTIQTIAGTEPERSQTAAGLQPEPSRNLAGT